MADMESMMAAMNVESQMYVTVYYGVPPICTLRSKDIYSCKEKNDKKDEKQFNNIK